jgi:hypothetical protein
MAADSANISKIGGILFPGSAFAFAGLRHAAALPIEHTL